MVFEARMKEWSLENKIVFQVGHKQGREEERESEEIRSTKITDKKYFA